MDFANERYVRLYVRNTTSWRLLGWQGRAVWLALYREADQTGAISLHGRAPAQVAALHGELPADVASAGMAHCLDLGWLLHDGDRLVIPRYAEANEAAASDKQRAKEYRARHRSSRNVTTASQNVSPASRASRRVPDGVTEASQTDTRRGSDFMLEATAQSWQGFDREFAFIGARPQAERARALAAIRASNWCQANPTLVSPLHVVRKWPHYAAGGPAMQSVATKPAEPTELEKLYERWKQLDLAREQCLYGEDAKKARITARMTEVTAQIDRLKGGANGRA